MKDFIMLPIVLTISLFVCAGCDRKGATVVPKPPEAKDFLPKSPGQKARAEQSRKSKLTDYSDGEIQALVRRQMTDSQARKVASVMHKYGFTVDEALREWDGLAEKRLLGQKPNIATCSLEQIEGVMKVLDATRDLLRESENSTNSVSDPNAQEVSTSSDESTSRPESFSAKAHTTQDDHEAKATFDLNDHTTGVIADSFNGMAQFDEFTILAYTGAGGVVRIPSMINGAKVTKVGGTAFMLNDKIVGLIVPSSVTQIDADFSTCVHLRSITVESSNPKYSSLDGVLFDAKRHTLIQYPVAKSGRYQVPESVTRIGRHAFDFTMADMEAPNTNCEVTLSDNILTVDDEAFGSCSGLTRIPTSIRQFGKRSFGACLGLTNVTIGTGVTYVGAEAFNGCENLQYVTIPASVTAIGKDAFYGCSKLESLVFLGSPPEVEGTHIAGTGTKIYYTRGMTGWTSTFFELQTLERSPGTNGP